MRVTPPVRCIVKIFSVFAAAFSLAFISCAANDDSASLTIQMPGSSSSRAISSEGHLLGEGAELELNYSVYIRNSDNEEVEKYTNVAPGTKLTISALRPGSYKVAIRGIAWGSVMFYGAADAVVQGGVENTVGIQLEEVNRYALIGLPSDTSQMIDLITGKITCENGDSYDVNTPSFQWYDSADASPTEFAVYTELSTFFFEPGFTYDFKISIIFNNGTPTKNFTSSATATKDGIVVTVN